MIVKNEENTLLKALAKASFYADEIGQIFSRLGRYREGVGFY